MADRGEAREKSDDTGASAAGDFSVRFEEVIKRFGAFTAIDRVSLAIGSGEFFALLGPSGCGKTTLLRLVAGFETADAGRIRVGGQDLGSVPPYRRPVNTMFQSYALFPHLSVAANVGFGLRYDGLGRREIAGRVEEMLALVRLEGLGGRKPDQLSGGQRQRVALARALAKRPKVLLLDEPLAALDRKLRETTQSELVQLQRRLGTTFIIVTHDQDEAMTLADRMAVMDHGRIVQVGTPREIYEKPNSRYVADFVGDVNLIEARVIDSAGGRSRLHGQGLGEVVVAAGDRAQPGAVVWLAIRPEQMVLTQERPDAANACAGTVTEQSYLGDTSIYKVRLDEGPVLKCAASNGARGMPARPARDERVWLSFAPDSAVMLTR